jgi:hypothetical protein
MSSRQLGVLTPLESVVRAVERVRGAPLRAFLSRHGDPSRDVLWYLARRRCGVTLRVLGEKKGGMRYATVSEAMRRIERRLAADRAMAAFVQKVERQLLTI